MSTDKTKHTHTVRVSDAIADRGRFGDGGRRGTVDGSRRRKDEVAAGGLAEFLQQNQRAHDIVLVVQQRQRHGFAHRLTCHVSERKEEHNQEREMMESSRGGRGDKSALARIERDTKAVRGDKSVEIIGFYARSAM